MQSAEHDFDVPAAASTPPRTLTQECLQAKAAGKDSPCEATPATNPKPTDPDPDDVGDGDENDVEVNPPQDQAVAPAEDFYAMPMAQLFATVTALGNTEPPRDPAQRRQFEARFAAARKACFERQQGASAPINSQVHGHQHAHDRLLNGQSNRVARLGQIRAFMDRTQTLRHDSTSRADAPMVRLLAAPAIQVLINETRALLALHEEIALTTHDLQYPTTRAAELELAIQTAPLESIPTMRAQILEYRSEGARLASANAIGQVARTLTPALDKQREFLAEAVKLLTTWRDEVRRIERDFLAAFGCEWTATTASRRYDEAIANISRMGPSTSLLNQFGIADVVA